MDSAEHPLTAENNTDSVKPNIFISYSRRDTEFADEINKGLIWAGFETSMDRLSIEEGEDWKKRLRKLIAGADTFVFILSTASAVSEICTWEIEVAIHLSKRIIPVLAEDLGEYSVTDDISALNYVRFDPYEDGRERSFMEGLNALVSALKTDLNWLREHNRLLTRAYDWDAADRSDTRLLRGQDIIDAKKWIKDKPANSPGITKLHHEFIETSEKVEAHFNNEELKRLEEIDSAQKEKERALGERETAVGKLARRTFMGIAGTSVFAVGAGIAMYQRAIATEQAERGRLAKQAAEEALENSNNELENWQRLISEGNNLDTQSLDSQPVEIVNTDDTIQTGNTGEIKPTWAIKAVGADQSLVDGAGVVMAHIGAGLDISHPAFRGMELIQKDFTGEGNGDRNGHGSMLAGLAFGRDFDNQRVGVAPGVSKVLVAKVLGGSGGTTTKNAIPLALDWIANYEGGIADVVFFGLGNSYPRNVKFAVNGGQSIEHATATTLREYIQALRTIESISLAARARGKGMTIISAGGNDSYSQDTRLPVTSPNSIAKGVISVGAIADNGGDYTVAEFSNSEPTLVAPGVDVLSAKLGGGSTNMSGTSIATGVAAGTAALWWQFVRNQNPETKVTEQLVWQHMKNSIKSDVFDASVNEVDRGLGLIQAPDTG